MITTIDTQRDFGADFVKDSSFLRKLGFELYNDASDYKDFERTTDINNSVHLKETITYQCDNAMWSASLSTCADAVNDEYELGNTILLDEMPDALMSLDELRSAAADLLQTEFGFSLEN